MTTVQNYSDLDFANLSYHEISRSGDISHDDGVTSEVTVVEESERLLYKTEEWTDVWNWGWTINIIQEKRINYEKFLGTWKNETGVYSLGVKYDPNGKLVGYSMPDDPLAIGYPAKDISGEQHQNIHELIYILGNHADTQMHEVLMMYYWNIYFGEDVYDIDLEALLGLFNTDTFIGFGGYGSGGSGGYGGMYGGGFVVKVDELTSAPILTETQLSSALESWLSGSQLSNAKSVLTTVRGCETTYKINSVFTYALMMQECSMGTASSSWVRENNWTSLVGYRTCTIYYS